MTKKIYEINDRVEYWAKVNGLRTHRIGFIKARKRGLFGEKYYICVASGNHEIDVVRSKQIFGKLIKQ